MLIELLGAALLVVGTGLVFRFVLAADPPDGSTVGRQVQSQKEVTGLRRAA